MGSHIFDRDFGDKNVPIIRDFKPSGFLLH